MTTCLPLAEVRDRLSPLVSSVQTTHERVVITKNGHPAAVLIAYEDLESLQETVEILADPGIVDEIRAALAEPERFTLEDIRRDLEARGGSEDGDR
ncbi:type II toxin-antitoxin system Phd/YefM family antitoxin [Nocardia tengchongensis]|uniref:Antitoxin n=1 Tax=Nocardia tengchongensis TaxID=2055889 RepID=A0ABX8CYC6_9NOCA|nr:type II toxin-antitoxin system Phd/YefM family antitoxin [Nocardia tengchongensis]QVI24479.1 type II toxin-antitoxin system Phd/YefM family antitoxin [Nocardia tengchongensis]